LGDQQGVDMNLLHRFLREEDGPTAVEYAVMLALIIVVCLVAIKNVGTHASSMWGSNQSNLDQAFNASSS
jgi:pilus assembly protein Flp/PilA